MNSQGISDILYAFIEIPSNVPIASEIPRELIKFLANTWIWLIYHKKFVLLVWTCRYDISFLVLLVVHSARCVYVIGMEIFCAYYSVSNKGPVTLKVVRMYCHCIVVRMNPLVTIIYIVIIIWVRAFDKCDRIAHVLKCADHYHFTLFRFNYRYR